MKISQRERALLLFTGLLFIVVMPFFMIVKPMIAVSTAKLEELSLMSEQAVLMSVEINTVDSIKLEHEKASKELETYREHIPAMEKSYNIHYKLTDMARSTGVEVESLNIGAYSVIKQEVKNEETGASTMEDTAIYQSAVTMKVKGGLAQILDMVQAIDDQGKYMVLTEFAVNNMNIDQVLTGTLGISFYAADATAKIS